MTQVLSVSLHGKLTEILPKNRRIGRDEQTNFEYKQFESFSRGIILISDLIFTKTKSSQHKKICRYLGIQIESSMSSCRYLGIQIGIQKVADILVFKLTVSMNPSSD